MLLRFGIICTGLLLLIPSASAQTPDVDAWMARHFGEKPGVKRDIAADEAVYAAVGLDSLRTNRFIGWVSGTVRLNKGGMPMDLLLWSDTLAAVLQLSTRDDTTTYAADLRTNTITISSTGTDPGEVNTVVCDLRERVLVNWYRYRDDGAPWTVFRKKRYEPNAGILGQDPYRSAVVKGDTVLLMRHRGMRSPFLDALEWLPYGGDYPFDLVMQMARAGDPLPMSLHSSLGNVSILSVNPGVSPRPVYRMGTHVEDLRGKAHQALPIRTRNTRYSGMDRDPLITLPEGSMGGMGTGSEPVDPEVTWTGPRALYRRAPVQPCGETGTVVVRVWVDGQGTVRRAEVDQAKSTLRSKACLNSALESAKQETFYPMEGSVAWHENALTFTYRGRQPRR